MKWQNRITFEITSIKPSLPSDLEEREKAIEKIQDMCEGNPCPKEWKEYVVNGDTSWDKTYFVKYKTTFHEREML